tara:strand:+ start:118 stop:2124 length:2007 start_codon:yes stop_codon:yes gene_type:complete
MTKAMRQLERQLQAEKRKLHEKEKALTELEQKYAATARRVTSDDTKAEQELNVLTEKVKEMTREIEEKDERLRANEELLNKMHSEKKKQDGELERMRVSLKDKDEVVKKLEDDLIQQKSKEKTTSPGKTNDDKNGIIIAQQHLKQKDRLIQAEQSKVAALEEQAKRAKAERDSLERQLKVAEEKETSLSARVDAMQRDRDKSSSDAKSELFEANRKCLELRTERDAKDAELREMRVKLKETKDLCENEQKVRVQTQEDCAIYIEDLLDAADVAKMTICEHQKTIETNGKEMDRLRTIAASAEKKCERAAAEAAACKASLEHTQTVLNTRVEEIERLRSEANREKDNMSSKLRFLEDETASLHAKVRDKQATLNAALGDVSKYQRESEQSKRQLEAFRASKEVTEEQLREERENLQKSEQNCEQLSDMLKKNVERHANVLSANERMKNTEIENLKDALKTLERKAMKVAEVVHIHKSFFDGLDAEAQVIVENFCAASKNVSSPTPSKTTIKLSSSPSAHENGKTPMTAPLSIRDNFVSAPSSPADRFQTPKTSMRTTSRLGRTSTTTKSAGKPVTFSSSSSADKQRSHVSQRIWGMVSEASKINVDLQGLAETAKKRLSQEHKTERSAGAVKALRLDVDGGEDSGKKPKLAGTPSKRRVLQPVPFARVN